MPRKPRLLTETGIYHVILRGNGRQLIFESDDDYRKLIEYLDKMTGRHNIVTVAWCLMSNHIHLLLDDPDGNLGACLRDIATAYAVYFNRMHGHRGAVFEGRYKSVPIDSDEQLLTAVCYIHENPEKAGICNASKYIWSSYNDYICGKPIHSDPERVLAYVGGIEAFKRYSQSGKHTSYTPRFGLRLTDDEALEIAREVIGAERLGSLKPAAKSARTSGLQALRDAALSVHQVECVTDISRGIIDRTMHPRNV